ncbi:hypothetical protein [Streptomyces sp. NPDC053079]|uniref:hypothetical protein n=1 Tax=Streptomyces sp. NPDC053079 TaxID=3365697 RepID=UPI0037D133BF
MSDPTVVAARPPAPYGEHHRTTPCRRLAEADHFRPNAYALHRGRRYPAAVQADTSGLIALTTGHDRPEDLVTDPRDPGAGHFLAGLEQLDAWYRIHWTFRLQCCPFDAVGTVNGRIKGVYAGGSWGFADNGQLTRETGPERVHTRYAVEVDLDGVTELEQHRTGRMATAAAAAALGAGSIS